MSQENNYFFILPYPEEIFCQNIMNLILNYNQTVAIHHLLTFVIIYV